MLPSLEAAVAAGATGADPEAEVAVWHVTTSASAEKILRQGLEPRIGPRSRSARETSRAIYVFPDGLSLVDGLSNWLADEFPDHVRLSVLELRVPGSWIEQDAFRWEAVILRDVPPERVRVLVPDLDEWNGTYPDGVPPSGWFPDDGESEPQDLDDSGTPLHP